MLAVIRLFLIALFILFSGVFGLLLCIFVPFHPNHVHRIATWYGSVSKLLGVTIEISVSPEVSKGPYVFVANHQNSYDIFTITNAVPERTVSIGKKSLKWIPFFGQLYWLSGNILIDRANRSKALGTISKAANKIKHKQLSVWMFPEGTRSYGKGLLPFKTGAFHTALQAEVPIVPVCMSTTHKTIKLNRWNNGTIYIELLAPIKLQQNSSIREQAQNVHAIMDDKIKQLDAKVAEQESK
ncbi:1-acyl-sn-glycerol-3-phosphate acyltransferase [Pseudoalteromonas ulvae UL12]|uniref:1-acyl-sn-glycerol-3-phosphate acyltransferase n=1 Tax=Pseudoalteromonas ulvae TaxID=107327 RepID=A0A244CU10_PSEDV|nr:1-acylglycerol-3-phosphate O-acyltransferase [Pseudoalteromonas ulvae]MBE0362970.1 1-acyl-sn-glycerol-3-phosphate acyltransferase [Pseudoalteromonas ulvae UL12]OUL59074.1 1-acyl-sn-glycerol-3-phosphate acyltransferase [Pseudoalteromonas ulvae]